MGSFGVKESRKAFEGLGGSSPDKLFGGLPTPCYILDEARSEEHTSELQSQ